MDFISKNTLLNKDFEDEDDTDEIAEIGDETEMNPTEIGADEDEESGELI
ncbi:MAG: hypothetical protein AAB564_00570 [Patescibacteria group bacterium]